MATVRQERRLPQIVHQELRSDLNTEYAIWREDNPDGDIIDWMVKLPDFMYWSANYDTNSARWHAWVAFWDWFPFQARLVVADAAQKAAQKKESAELDEYLRHSKKIASLQAVP